ncbi:MAG: EF-P lysine aminoacylase EpmA [Gammaproteobacteria bacterium]|nr:EF-P lysine aminoacylase EpmA [Gammaproteobacteria bacterium]
MTDWRPAASAEVLKLRADLFADARRFFAERGVMEVDTPVLGSSTASEVYLASLETRLSGAPIRRYYLQTSPESAMKRLLAAGSGSVFQFARAFRDGEAGRLHNPEFVMLEWYRVGFDLTALMDEVEALISRLLGEAPPARRLSYRDAFRIHAGIDPFTAAPADVADACRELGLETPPGDAQTGLDLILSARVQPALGSGRSFLFDFSPAQAAMSAVRDESPPVASRFELFIDGIEIANGYDELRDPAELLRRTKANAALRERGGLPVPPEDRALLDAMRHGLPACAGVAMGFDRVVMLAAGLDDVRQAMAFPLDRA